ncbi:MAG: GNAT family N-acetyltransferase [Methyloligellaceae bacterium]
MLTSDYTVLSSKQYDEWRDFYDRIALSHVFAAPKYIEFLSWYYGYDAELFVYQYDDGFVYYPYFKRPLEGLDKLSGVDLDLKGRFDIHSSWYNGGPLCNDPDKMESVGPGFIEAFRDHVRRNAFVTEFVRFDTNIGNHLLYPQDEVIFNRETVFVDLTKGPDDVWKGYTTQNRSRLKKALAAGVTIREHTSDDEAAWDDFVKVYQDEMVRKNAPHHLRFNEEFFHQYRRRVGRNTMLLGAWYEDKLVGGSVVVFDQHLSYHFLNASDPDHWKLGVNHVLYSDSIRWSQENGFRLFDFMGGREGVFKFKKHFSKTRGKLNLLNAIHDKPFHDEILTRAGLESGGHFPPWID